MSYIEALILGLIQGITEFLPVSSSGHLVMGQVLLNIQKPGISFEVAVHVATLFSVVLVFRKRLVDLLKGALQRDADSWRYILLLGVATIPAVLVGFGAKDFFESLFDSPMVVGVSLLVTGSFLWTAKGALARDPVRPPGLRAAVLMGLAQACAIIPGISRSGATVVTGLWAGVEAEEAAAFSFLMGIPVILGAALLQFLDLSGGGALNGPTLLGSAVAAVAGVLAIKTFVGMLRRKSFHRFGPYCLAAGALFLLFLGISG